MIELTKDQIKDVAEQFDCGFRCYYNTETKEIKSIIDTTKHIYADDEMWQEDIDELDAHFDKYIEIESPDSRYSFQIMEWFIETITNEKLKEKLYYALSRKKPFQNFKYQVDNSGEYRQKWFDFKQKMLEEWVVDQIEFINGSRNAEEQTGDEIN